MSGGRTRRGVLAGAAGLLLAPAAARAQSGVADALRDLLAREEAAARAYRAAGMERLAAHEAAHAAALRPQLEALGVPVPAPSRRLRGAAARLAAGGGRAAAIALEEELVAAHRAALGALEEPAVRRTSATIMAGHGQHLVVLHRDPLDALL